MVEFRHVAKGLSQANKSNKKNRSKSGGKIEVSPLSGLRLLLSYELFLSRGRHVT
jgi:hypothetical protein